MKLSRTLLCWVLTGVAALLCVTLIQSPALSLCIGLCLGLLRLNPSAPRIRKLQGWVLSIAVIGLGAGLDFKAAVRVGSHGMLMTGGLLIGVFLVGAILCRLLKMDRELATLISTGTAICGGSAIAAIAAVLKPKDSTLTLSLTLVFLLNAIALFMLPPLGHMLRLDEPTFGWWAALAIHDTSSVVGATLAYGKEALILGTTIKLARALWILPVATAVALLWTKSTNGKVRMRIPWFIPGFLLMSAVFSFVPELMPWRARVSSMARVGFSLALFFIGMGVMVNDVRNTSLKALFYAITLWGVSLTVSFFVAMRINGG